ncbi:choice-of-anchor K domain-containing protein [Okeania sp. SIO1I7]|uniref:choice-of-anchor K domain-containing protein n=1 Tax=Okeania sp. SIO1I7 TaxID=2607772 RepID=UPI0013F6DFC0|nr:choice-of-anchor K domain-containing protein [Okeania sp. SIO1I7]NET24090.1 PEP-CTERM sorting domain-containing protein [Okeania sp. SIO1I7]
MNIPKLLTTLVATTTILFAATENAQAITFSGTSSGSWGLPVVSTGVEFLSDENGGTNNRLTWGIAATTSFRNYVQYDGLSFSTDVNTLFAVGDLTYGNGATYYGFNGDFPLEVELSFTNPFNNAENFNYTFNIFNTPNIYNDPVLDGDILLFTANGLTNDSFNFAGVDYTLKLAGFSSDGGNTFLSEFNSPEHSVANAILYAEIIKVDVPEPTTIIALGLFGIYLTGSLNISRNREEGSIINN